jgi:hypothetical protein
MAWTAFDHAVAALKNPSTKEADIKKLAAKILTEYGEELAGVIENSDELRDHTDDHMGDVNAAAGVIRRHTPKGA